MSDVPRQPRACHFCGLPMAAPRGSETSSSDPQPEYCCYGCQLAEEITGATGDEGLAKGTLARLGTAIFFTMNVMVFSMALWGQETSAAADLPEALAGLFRYLSLLFSIPVFVLLAAPLAESAWHNHRRGLWGMDLLLVLGVAASFVTSAVAVFQDNGPIYFEVGCMILVLVTLGRWLEATGKWRTTEAVRALAKLLPENARRVANGQAELVPLSALCVGDRVRVLPGESIPCDGVVRRGTGGIDEQILTGESLPVARSPGDPVFAGTVNLDGDLLLDVTATSNEGTLARFAAAVRAALERKGHFQQLADRISAVFLPAVTLLAIGVFVYHGMVTGPSRGLTASLAVLVIACPCALGIATPMAVWAAMGWAASRQVLFQEGGAVERLAGVRAIRLDKTGTLTSGKLRVAEVHGADGFAEEIHGPSILCLAERSRHPLSIAIHSFLRQRADGRAQSSDGLDRQTLEVRTYAGRGIMDVGETWGLGNEAFLVERGFAWRDSELRTAHDRLVRAGKSVVCIGHDGSFLAVFGFEETLRPEARQAIDSLRRMGLDVGVLTGDHAERGALLAKELNVPVTADLRPEDKMEALDQARRRFHCVAMVGDGVNDAPALAASDVGIAMGCGADVSRAAAAVCLLSSDLSRIPQTIDLARRTVKVIKQNLFWSFFYNVLGIGFAATGKLNPILAAAAMAISSAFVVGNSLRLRATVAGDVPLAAVNGPAAETRAKSKRETDPSRHVAVSLPERLAKVIED